jgi:hypothetical protein
MITYLNLYSSWAVNQWLDASKKTAYIELKGKQRLKKRRIKLKKLKLNQQRQVNYNSYFLSIFVALIFFFYF